MSYHDEQETLENLKAWWVSWSRGRARLRQPVFMIEASTSQLMSRQCEDLLMPFLCDFRLVRTHHQPRNEGRKDQDRSEAPTSREHL